MLVIKLGHEEGSTADFTDPLESPIPPPLAHLNPLEQFNPPPSSFSVKPYYVEFIISSRSLEPGSGVFTF